MRSRRHSGSNIRSPLSQLLLPLALLAMPLAPSSSSCSCGEEEIPCNNNLDCPLRAQVCVDGLCVTGVDGGEADGGRTDAGMTDAGVADAGVADAGMTDAGMPDAVMPDTVAVMTDAAMTDACVAEGGVADAHSADSGVISSWWDQGWQYRRKLTFDNSGQAEDLVDFTVLVRLDSGRVDYTHLGAAAADLRFVDADDSTRLAHEIERWDSSGQSFIWVRVPLIPAASTDDHIWMYYGNATASDEQDAAGTWSDRYRVVAHLGEVFRDSTGQTPSAFWNGILAGEGLIGPATQFNGDDSYIFLPDRTGIADLFALDTGVGPELDGATLSAWIFKTGPGDHNFPRLMDKSSDTRGGDGWAFSVPDQTASGKLSLEKGFSSNRGSFGTTGSELEQARWFHVALTYEHSSASNRPVFYVDGIAQTTAMIEPPAGEADSDVGQPLYIGNRSGATDRSFEGLIDEVRIQKGMRTAAWIRAQHLSMTDALVSYGVEEL